MPVSFENDDEKMSDIQLTKLLLDIPVPFVSAQSWIVYDCLSEQVLFGRMERERREIASLTKIMTCHAVLDMISRFEIEEKQHYIKVSQNAASTMGTSAELR